MNYKIEQLLPLAAELADRYTSKESTSVTYETAGALMEAVLYCMKECEDEGNAVIRPGSMPGVREIYRRGAGLVIEKARRARVLHDAIIRDFEDYGCMNYRDTIQKGMPEFFLHYDPVFAPGRHILSLDYPLLCGNPPLCGVDLIFEYLKGIWTEMQFLNRFHPDMVRRLLSQVSPEYKELYLDNLCDPVLFHVVGCVLSKQAHSPIPAGFMQCSAVRTGKKSLPGSSLQSMKPYTRIQPDILAKPPRVTLPASKTELTTTVWTRYFSWTCLSSPLLTVQKRHKCLH